MSILSISRQGEARLLRHATENRNLLELWRNCIAARFYPRIGTTRTRTSDSSLHALVIALSGTRLNGA